MGTRRWNCILEYFFSSSHITCFICLSIFYTHPHIYIYWHLYASVELVEGSSESEISLGFRLTRLPAGARGIEDCKISVCSTGGGEREGSELLVAVTGAATGRETSLGGSLASLDGKRDKSRFFCSLTDKRFVHL